MIVVFRRTGEKRYAVEALREGLPVVEINPAPGYDRLIPHDMMHMVVEAQLGLTRGIYGQLAAGGTAGTFRLTVNPDQSVRAATRERKRVTKRGKKLLKDGRDDCTESERATWICWQEWLARSSAKNKAGKITGVTDLGIKPSKLDEICKHLDELSSQWTGLYIGQNLAVSWPDLAIVKSHR